MAVPVERFAWLLDDQQVVVELGDLDEDEVGPELALELLRESGWQRAADLA